MAMVKIKTTYGPVWVNPAKVVMVVEGQSPSGRKEVFVEFTDGWDVGSIDSIDDILSRLDYQLDEAWRE